MLSCERWIAQEAGPPASASALRREGGTAPPNLGRPPTEHDRSKPSGPPELTGRPVFFAVDTHARAPAAPCVHPAHGRARRDRGASQGVRSGAGVPGGAGVARGDAAQAGEEAAPGGAGGAGDGRGVAGDARGGGGARAAVGGGRLRRGVRRRWSASRRAASRRGAGGGEAVRDAGRVFEAEEKGYLVGIVEEL